MSLNAVDLAGWLDSKSISFVFGNCSPCEYRICVKHWTHFDDRLVFLWKRSKAIWITHNAETLRFDMLGQSIDVFRIHFGAHNGSDFEIEITASAFFALMPKVCFPNTFVGMKSMTINHAPWGSCTEIIYRT